MTINDAILGILSWKPSTGYEIKKIFENSSFMYWSGNNNQIYRSLLQLQEDGFVSGEILHQGTAPSKKVYTITKNGLDELKKGVLSAPETPELKKDFLVQLAWSDQLTDEELNELLIKYENEIKIQCLLEQEKKRRGINAPKRNLRETIVWDKISENLISSYKNELNWVQSVRSELFQQDMINQRDKIQYEVIQNKNQTYIECIAASSPVSNEEETLEYIALCGEYDTNFLMLHASILSEEFFKYRSGLAGRILQKFSNYRVKVAIIRPDNQMNFELNSGDYMIFDTKEKAEEWLLNTK